MRVFLRKSPAQSSGRYFTADALAAASVPLSRWTLAPRVLGRLGVVGDHHDRLAVLAVQHLQQAQDLVGGGAVEVAGRLVADQERRIGHDGARDRHALLLAARELPRLVPGAVREADQRQRDRARAGALGRGQVGQQQRQLDVPLGRQHGHQVVELEDEADVGGAPARRARRSRAGRCAGRRSTMLPPVGRVEPADQVEQGGLAGARRPHQRHEVAARDVEVDAVQHLDPLAAAPVGLGDAADLDQALAASRGAARVDPAATASASVTAAPSRSEAGGDSTTRSPSRRPLSTWRSPPTLWPERDAAALDLAVGVRRRPRRCVALASAPRRRRHQHAAARRPAPPAAAPAASRKRHAHAHVRHDARVLRLERDAHLHGGLAAVGGRDDGDHLAGDLPVRIGVQRRLHRLPGRDAVDEGLVDVHLDLERVHVHDGADAGAREAAARRDRRDHLAGLRRLGDDHAAERRADHGVVELHLGHATATPAPP